MDWLPANPVGTYSDFIGAFNFIVVGPAPESPVVSQVFNEPAHTGTGSFTIFPGLPPATSAFGEIVVTYDLFSRSPNDPSFNPDTDTISTGNELRAAASVTVVPSTQVPEPGVLLSVFAGLTVLYLKVSARRP